MAVILVSSGSSMLKSGGGALLSALKLSAMLPWPWVNDHEEKGFFLMLLLADPSKMLIRSVKFL